MSSRVFFESGVELGFAEIGPEGGGDDEFGVGDLPEEKIADAHFAAGADEQIGIGNVAGVEMLGKGLLRDVGGVEFAGFDFFRDAADGVHDLGATTVAESHNERQAVVFRERLNGFAEMVLDVFGQAINLAYDFEADVVFV